MIFRIATVVEIIASFVCIYSIYESKVKLNVKTVGVGIGLLLIMEFINVFQLGGIFSILGYGVLFVYCKNEFKKTIIETIVSLLMYIVILSFLQCICNLFVSIVINKQDIRYFISNVILLLISILILPKCGLSKLHKTLCLKNKLIFYLLGFMFLVIAAMYLQGKVFYKVQIKDFILVIPAIILLLYLVMKWHTAQMESERMEQQYEQAKEATKEYDELLTNIRLRQHELKNHLAAIFSAHYTYKTYEKLVRVQEEYCNKIMKENEYNNLILLGDKVLVGYLHGKFQEAEKDEIQIQYRISAKINKINVSTYYLIEMLGILFDNAMEALKSSEQKIISFEFCELDDVYQFSIGNPYSYVSYEEISEWFQLEKSEKGKGRGLGLYHLKCLCRDWNCDVGCRNIEIYNTNWILFTLKIGKADNI